MKTIKTSVISALIIVLYSIQLIAIDGYRGFKWGMTKQQVMNVTNDSKDSFCDFNDLGTDLDGINTLECEDFPFGNQKRYGFFLLVGNELLRIGVSIDPKDVSLLVKIFNDEFGISTDQRITQPAKDGILEWDNGTILLKKATIETQEQKTETIATLIYTSRDFDKKLQQLKLEQLEDSAIGK